MLLPTDLAKPESFKGQTTSVDLIFKLIDAVSVSTTIKIPLDFLSASFFEIFNFSPEHQLTPFLSCRMKLTVDHRLFD